VLAKEDRHCGTKRYSLWFNGKAGAPIVESVRPTGPVLSAFDGGDLDNGQAERNASTSMVSPARP